MHLRASPCTCVHLHVHLRVTFACRPTLGWRSTRHPPGRPPSPPRSWWPRRFPRRLRPRPLREHDQASPLGVTRSKLLLNASLWGVLGGSGRLNTSRGEGEALSKPVLCSSKPPPKAPIPPPSVSRPTGGQLRLASSSTAAAPPKKLPGVRWKSVVALQPPHTNSAPTFRTMPRNNGPQATRPPWASVTMPRKPHRLPGPAFVGIKGAHTLPVHNMRDPP